MRGTQEDFWDLGHFRSYFIKVQPTTQILGVFSSFYENKHWICMHGHFCHTTTIFGQMVIYVISWSSVHDLKINHQRTQTDLGVKITLFNWLFIPGP